MIFTIKKENKHKNGIYIIRSLIDDRVYTGSATNFHKRFGRHLSTLRNNKHCNRKLQSFFNKYGEDSLSFDLLCIIDKKEDLLPVEQYYMDLLQSATDGFNIRDDVRYMGHISRESREKSANTRRGIKFTDIWRERISIAKKKQYTEDGHHNTGRTYPKEHTQHMSQSNIKRVIEGRNVMVERFKNGEYTGENHPKSKISNDVALYIKQDMAKGIKRAITISKYNITLNIYKDIQRGKTWSHIKI